MKKNQLLKKIQQYCPMFEDISDEQVIEYVNSYAKSVEKAFKLTKCVYPSVTLLFYNLNTQKQETAIVHIICQGNEESKIALKKFGEEVFDRQWFPNLVIFSAEAEKINLQTRQQKEIIACSGTTWDKRTFGFATDILPNKELGEWEQSEKTIDNIPMNFWNGWLSTFNKEIVELN